MKKEKQDKILDVLKNPLYSDFLSKGNEFEEICDIAKVSRLDISDLDHIEKVIKALVEAPMKDDRAELNDVLSIMKVKYGENDPRYIGLQKNAESTVLILDTNILEDLNDPNGPKYEVSNGQNAVDLNDRKHVIIGKQYSIKKSKIGKQRSVKAYGTGFIFKHENNHYVVTAAHVVFPNFSNITPRNIKDLRFVRNFMVRDDHAFDKMVTFDKSEVFMPTEDQELLSGQNFKLTSNAEDWAFIKIKPENDEVDINSVTALAKENVHDDKVELKSNHVYGLGHGLGMPLKFSPCGKILSLKNFNDSDENNFNCEIDFFSGNSGSPIFDCEDHKLLGFLVRGKRDFYLSEKFSEEAILGVLDGRNAGEVFQKMNPPIKNIENENENEILHSRTLLQDQEPEPEPITSKEVEYEEYLLPYINLKNKMEGEFELNVYFPNAIITRTFDEKIGDIHIYEFIIKSSNKKGIDKKNRLRNFSIIDGPINLVNTDQTIEIRVLDEGEGVYHFATLEFINAFEEESDLYWTSCLPKEFHVYDKGKDPDETVGISIGKFDKGTFRKSLITSARYSDINDVWGLRLTGNGELLKGGKALEKDDNTIIFNSIGNGMIKRTNHFPGRNPKPIRFIYYKEETKEPV